MEEAGLEALVHRAQQGDREAAGELIRRYGDRIRAAIRQRLAPRFRRRFDTEDVFQSALAVSLEDLQGIRYEGEKAFVAWLTTVAERRLLGNIRKHRAERRDVAREHTQGAAADVTAGLTSPTRGAERAEVKVAIDEAVARLPRAEQQVIRLRSYEGLSFSEVAGVMGLSNKHAARDLFLRALKRMGELVENHPPPPED